ncbi:HAD family hydrolase [Rossellomorea aquimaris]|uniref:HAD family hydrolase n=1 Tax=Rossellomorea aquimaris TaxID=189382 RepID=UPI0009ECD774|nr:HAD family hydrolase [Rossellomorea aquimaris]
MSNHSLLLFDLDDTLLCSPWFEEGLKHTLKSHPLTKILDAPLFLEKKLHVPTCLIEQFKRRDITPKNFRRERWKHAFANFQLFPGVDVIDEIDDLFLKTGMSFIRENPAITRLLHDVSNHYQVGIITNALYDARLKISRMGLSNIFPSEIIFQAEELGYRKPDPEIYHVALEHFNKKPCETIFIGDSWIHDVVGPIDVGMEAIWVNRKGVSQPTSHIPLGVVSEIGEIREILLR